jgi:cysteine desulfurase family protein (TIGR01976 family)
MTFNVEKIRKDFPSLESGIAFFDGPGGSQVPRAVGKAISEAITMASSNRGTVTESEQNADKCVIEYRKAVADLTGGDPRGVIYGRSWTQLSYDLSRTLAKSWGPGDEIVVTNLDHDSNIRPWIQAAEAKGATVRWAKFDTSTGELSVDAVTSQITSKTKFVTVTGASNTLGTRPDLKAIADAVHSVGALFCVDGVHLTPHKPIDVKEIGADFFGFSAYKMMGPHCGSVVADPALLETLQNDKLLPSTMVVPERFEFGTLPYEIMAGVTAAIDYIAGMDSQSGTRRERIIQSMKSLDTYEHELFEYLENQIVGLKGVKTFGHAKNRTPTIYFQLENHESVDVYKFLATKKVNAPASNFYALEISRALGLGDAGAIRAGLAPYSTHDDVDRLVAGLSELLN